MRIDVWSDYVCPFCSLGERHLSLALEDFPGRDEVEVVWRAFQLNPEAEQYPRESMLDTLARAKGMPAAQVEDMMRQLAEQTARVGLDFNWREGVNANTWDAHRVGQFAREQGLGPAWDAAVKEGFLSLGRNVADHDTLRGFAGQVGLDVAAVDRILGSGEYTAEVDADLEAARQIGVRGVPFFVFDGRLALSGAQPVEVFTRALAQAAGK